MQLRLINHALAAGAVLIWVLFSSMMLAAAPPDRRYVSETYPHALNTNIVSINLQPIGEVPEFVAVSVRPEEENGLARAMENWRAAIKTNRNARSVAPPTQKFTAPEPKWLPFQTNLQVDLGPGDGQREILFSYKYRGQTLPGGWSGSSIRIHRGTPTLRIVNPTNFLSSQPMIQLQGVTSRKFRTLLCEEFDSQGKKVAGEHIGLGVSFPGGNNFKYSEDYFSFLDLALSPGTNTFVLHGTDEFGNAMTTNIVIVFSTAHDHTPPLIAVNWPKPNAELAGTDYTIDGRMDDFTAKLEAHILTNNGSITRDALVERNGFFWIENIPLALDANRITLTATDAAGNTSETNFTVIGREGPIITMNPVNPPDLWKQFITVTGQVTPPGHEVRINGVQAKVNSDGTWNAERVPVVSPNGGTATFEMSAVPSSGIPAKEAKVAEVVSAQATLTTNAVTLNASAPACGIFRLHINETEGKNFIIWSSTNLTEWTPILTNINAALSSDYTLDTTNHACRFFKLVPLP